MEGLITKKMYGNAMEALSEHLCKSEIDLDFNGDINDIVVNSLNQQINPIVAGLVEFIEHIRDNTGNSNTRASAEATLEQYRG